MDLSEGKVYGFYCRNTSIKKKQEIIDYIRNVVNNSNKYFSDITKVVISLFFCNSVDGIIVECQEENRVMLYWVTEGKYYDGHLEERWPNIKHMGIGINKPIHYLPNHIFE